MRAANAVTTVALVAIALWIGGLVALGAIVAPVVFGIVPAPTSADAMTLIFRRFDRIAMGCIAVVLLAEVALAVLRKPLERLDVFRAALAVVAFGLVVWQALAVSPKIEALHRSGAIRGFGDAGLALESLHRIAEAGGKAQALLALALIALHVVATAQGRSR